MIAHGPYDHPLTCKPTEYTSMHEVETKHFTPPTSRPRLTGGGRSPSSAAMARHTDLVPGNCGARMWHLVLLLSLRVRNFKLFWMRLVISFRLPRKEYSPSSQTNSGCACNHKKSRADMRHTYEPVFPSGLASITTTTNGSVTFALSRE